jgi:hypothetical protein
MQQSLKLAEVVDLERYPIADCDSPDCQAVIARIWQDLAHSGCCVLAGFIRPGALRDLEAQSDAVAHLAHHRLETVNVYNISLDQTLPDDHPGRIQMTRGNAFVARDQIPDGHIVQQLYVSLLFQRFVAQSFAMPVVYPMADPLAGLVVNVLEPGREHPWHFDTNAFTVSLMTRKPAGGGLFEYCPEMRSADDEHLAAVRAVITGASREGVRQLDLEPGDLQLFKGRYALHRVALVTGARARHTVIFAYCEQPGIVGSPERTRQLFGRVLPIHEDAACVRRRLDALLD